MSGSEAKKQPQLPVHVLVGLRNPGEQYALTRHNAGEWFVRLILDQYRLELKKHKSWPIELAKQSGLALALSTTYMNLSGQGLGQYCRYYQCLPASILVAHDDLDLPVGSIKLKFGGGDGGHNGLKSIIAHLQTKDFWRLRIGIGRCVGKESDVTNYVLSKPSAKDRTLIDEGLNLAQMHFDRLLRAEFESFMRVLHVKKAVSSEENKT